MNRRTLRLLVVLVALAGVAAGNAAAPAGSPNAPGATITVDSLADEQEFDGNCTLREALLAAALNLPWDGCAAGSGHDLIVFAVNGVIEMELGEFPINSPVTIRGNGRSETVIDARDLFPIFYVTETLELESLTLQNGRHSEGGAIAMPSIPGSANLVLDDVIIQDSVADLGGAIRVGRHNVDIRNSALVNNRADVESGGALYCNGCNLSVTDSIITDNVAEKNGGGILVIFFDNPALFPVTIARSTIAGNSAEEGDGGGIHCRCYLTLTDSTIRDNTAPAGNGGGLYGYEGSWLIEGSTVSGNIAEQGSGGGIYHDGNGYSVSFMLTNGTVSGNSAQLGGGLTLELYADDSAIIRYATIAGNTATSALAAGGAIFVEPAGNPLTLSRSIISGNSGSPTCYPSGDVDSEGYNVLQDVSCGKHGADQVGVDPLLGPLADNGGETATHALLPTSPAIDAADCLEEITADQRGVARPQGPDCDSGAYEFDGSGGYYIYLPIVLSE